MVKKRLSFQSCAHSSVGLQDYFEKSNGIVDTSHNSQRVHKVRETEILAGLCSSNVKEKSHCTSKNVHDSGILQQVAFSSKASQEMETGYRSKCIKQPPFSSNFQNGNCRGHSKRHLQREMGSVHSSTDANFHIPIHKKSQHLRFHVAGKTHQFPALPFSIATAPLEFSRVAKEVKLMLQNGNSYSPVPR